MKSLNQFICILASSLFLMCNAPIQTTAQTIAGKWLIDGSEVYVQFSEEGAVLLQTPGYESRQGLYYIEDGMLGIVYLDDSENLLGYEIKAHTANNLVLISLNENNYNLSYKGKHEIPQSYIQLLVDNFGDDIGGESGFANLENEIYASSDDEDMQQWSNEQGYADDENEEADFTHKGGTPSDTYEAPKSKIERLKNPGRLLQSLRPDNLSLVGCWEAESVGDPWVFDENGFWRNGNFDGSYNYGYEGLYNFDGKTLTIHVHSGGGMGMTVGDTYTYPIENRSASGFNFRMKSDYGDDYKPRYKKTNRYQLSEHHIGVVRAGINKEYLKNTKWVSGNTDYLFLGPNYLIIRKNGEFQQKHWLFAGNALWVKEISGRDDDYTKIGDVSNWTNEKFITHGSDGKTTFNAGYNVAGLNTNEQTLYINYLRINHAAYMQACFGALETTGDFKVEWNY